MNRKVSGFSLACTGRRRLLAAAAWALSFLLLVALAYLVGGKLDWKSLNAFPIGVLAAVMVLRLLGFALFATATWLALRPSLQRAGFVEIYQLSVTGFLLGNVTGGAGGMAIKALYLKRLHGLSYVEFAGVQMLLIGLVFAVSGLTALLGIAGLAMSGRAVPPLLVGASLGVLCLGLAPALFGHQLKRHDWLRGQAKVLSLFEGWQRLLVTPRLRNRLVALTGLRGFTGFVALGLLFCATEFGPDAFVLGGTIDGLTTVLQLVRIVPGNLGIFEWSIGLLGEASQFTLSASLLAAVLYRLSGIAVIGASGLLVLLIRPLLR